MKKLTRLWSLTRRRRSRRWLGATGVLLVAVLATWSAREYHRAADVEVTTALVSSGPIVRHIIATGTLKAVTTVPVGAQVSGTIQSLEADYNSVVHAGQVIATLDPAFFEAALREARAAMAQAQAAETRAEADAMGLDAAVEDARTKLARAEALAARQLISQSDLDLARIAMGEASAARQAGQSAILEARAALDQAKAALDQANDNLKHTAVASPIDGIVVARNVDVGQTVASTFQAPVLFNVATDLTHMQVEVDIDESDIGGVKEGEPATFQVESYADQTFRGTVLGVRLQPVAAPAAAPAAPGTSAPAAAASDVSAAVSYATIIDVSNPGEKLRPGMTATVTLDGSRLDHAVRIPNTALSFRPPPEVLGATGQRVTTASTTGTSSDTDRRQVWRYDGTEFTPVDVRVGLADGQWTQLVRGSLSPGDGLVTGASILRH